MGKIKKYFNQGFSLMETLIWVSIVGIFLSLIGFGGIAARDRARVKGATQELKVIEAALLDYYDNEGSYPPESAGLQALVDKNYIKSNNKSNKLVDPWGTEYIYTLSNDGHDFTIKSLGSDKKEGGTGTALDIIVSSSNASKENSNDQSFDYGKDYKLEKN